MSVMALDIETKNFANDIGGWGNTHMFQVSTVCTWDGDMGTIYIDKAGFDLPVLRDALDIYCIRKYINKRAYIDTSREMSKSTGERFTLNNLVKHTLDDSKTMDSAEAPIIWKQGKYAEVAEYCLKDCQLVFDLWKHGVEHGTVNGFSIEKAEERKIEVEW